MKLKIGDEVYFKYGKNPFNRHKPDSFCITKVVKVTPKRYNLENGEIIKKGITNSGQFVGHGKSRNYHPLDDNAKKVIASESYKMDAYNFFSKRVYTESDTPFTIDQKIKIYELLK